MRSIGDVIATTTPAMRRAQERYTRAKEAFLADGGTCFPCRDTGWLGGERGERFDPSHTCPDCDTGKTRLEQLRIGVQRTIEMESPLSPLALPLDTMRCANAEMVSRKVLEWIDGWPVGWRSSTPHRSNLPFLVLHGPTGSGKTTAAAHAALAVGKRMLLTPNVVNAKSAIDTMRERGAGRDPGPYQGEGDWKEPAPIVVDDLGIATYSDAAEGFHYSVIQARYERKWPTILTTNASMEPNGGERSLISRIGARAYYRILERATVVEMGGYNWRDPRNRR